MSLSCKEHMHTEMCFAFLQFNNNKSLSDQPMSLCVLISRFMVLIYSMYAIQTSCTEQSKLDKANRTLSLKFEIIVDSV